MTEAVIRILPEYTNIKNRDTLVTDMAQGQAHGAVCLTENHLNSSVSDVRYIYAECSTRHRGYDIYMAIFFIRCRAEFDYEDRVYKIKGTKTCVYGGVHGFEGNTVGGECVSY